MRAVKQRRAEPLSSDVIRTALARFLRDGDRYVLTQLVRFGNLPGPNPNEGLAMAFGDELLKHGQASDRMLRELLVDERQAPGQSGEAYLPYLGAHVAASRVNAGFDVTASWALLYELGGDARKVVRDGVVSGLVRLGIEGDAEALLRQLAGWTNGFLQTAVAIEALTRRAVLEKLADPAPLIERFEEATNLAENAGRAQERSQGRRRLLEVLAQVLPEAAARHPAFLGWLTGRASTQHPEIRACFEQALLGLNKAGLMAADLDRLRAALDKAAPPRRDPKTYVGTTRGRGRKAQRRAERK